MKRNPHQAERNGSAGTAEKQSNNSATKHPYEPRAGSGPPLQILLNGGYTAKKDNATELTRELEAKAKDPLTLNLPGIAGLTDWGDMDLLQFVCHTLFTREKKLRELLFPRFELEEQHVTWMEMFQIAFQVEHRNSFTNGEWRLETLSGLASFCAWKTRDVLIVLCQQWIKIAALLDESVFVVPENTDFKVEVAQVLVVAEAVLDWEGYWTELENGAPTPFQELASRWMIKQAIGEIQPRAGEVPK